MSIFCGPRVSGHKVGDTLKRGHNHSHTHYGQFSDANQPTKQVFGLETEIGVPEGNPEAKREPENSTHT